MRAVNRGLARKERRVPARIGIDEKSVDKGLNYESIVCDLDNATVEYVVDDREKESLESYYRQSSPEELAQIEAIAMDMAWAIKESLRKFWMYSYAKCAERYFKAWYFWGTHSRMAPMVEAARTPGGGTS